MTWSEIKKAVEDAGIAEEDEVSVIQCQAHDGNKTLRKLKLGKFVKLAEDLSESARKDASGCTC
jgi:hypothetical protein